MEPPVIEMPAGLPGFPDARRFVLLSWSDDTSPFSRLQCLDAEELEFLVAAPVVLFPDYAPELDTASVDALGLTCAEDALVLVLVTVHERAVDATANLLAPIVVNIHTNLAAQVVVPDAPIDDVRRRVFSFAEPLVQSVASA
jgi:flagellar assembly factor FliW